MANDVERPTKIAFAVSLLAAASCALAFASSCYPDFEFRPDPSGTSTTGASTSTGRPGTSATTSGAGGAHPTGSTTSSTSASKTASSSASGPSGPVCDVSTKECPFAESCCFDESVPPTDLCASSCPSGHLPLHCSTDAECAGKKCCAIFDTFTFAVKGTSCRADCNASDALSACDPTASSTCTCQNLLGSYFSNDKPTPPYDHYGYCN